MELVVGFSKELLKNTNPSLKNAIALFIAHLKFEANMNISLDNVNQSIATLIENEYQKLLKSLPLPTSHVSNHSSIDIGNLITSSVISNLNDPKWQLRKEALDFLSNKFNNHRVIISNFGNRFFFILFRY